MLTVLSLCERGKINFLISLLLPEHEHFVGSINSALKFRQRITFSPLLPAFHYQNIPAVVSEFFLTALKLWKWIYLQSYLDVISMGFMVQSGTLIFLLGMCAVDATTLYFEVCRAFETRSRTLRAILHRFETSIVPV